MKKAFLFAAMLAMATSCSVSEVDSIKETGKGIAPEITASYENNGTKTTITTNDEGVGTIWWKPADEINIFYGTLSTHYVSKNTENATTVAFGTTDAIGSTESASQNIWGLYPYDENAVCDGESVITTISAIQKGVAGTFDDDIFTSLAHSTSTVMTFYNVLGGIKFSLSRDDIKKITFKGNNSEDIAGKVKLEMDANGKPAAEITEGEKTITLTPKEGTTFAKNTNYYIVMLPTVLSNGFTMTFETETEIGTFEYTTKSIEIKRSVFSKKENIDTYAEFIPIIPIPEAIDLGLSVKWASFNLGASSPEECGELFAWGEIRTKNNFSWSNYLWCNGKNNELIKYNTSTHYGKNPDWKTILELADDAINVYFGNGWHIPTQHEWHELFDNCTLLWIEQDGECGYRVISNISGYENNSIFIPVNNNQKYSKYWSNCLMNYIYTPSKAEAYLISGDEGYNKKLYNTERCEGLLLRGVFDSTLE